MNEAPNNCRLTLMNQLKKLNDIFNLLSEKALNQAENFKPHNCEIYLRLALKAQAQTTRTYEALEDMPKLVNVMTNELSGDDHELRPFTRAQNVSIGANQKNTTMA